MSKPHIRRVYLPLRGIARGLRDGIYITTPAWYWGVFRRRESPKPFAISISLHRIIAYARMK